MSEATIMTFAWLYAAVLMTGTPLPDSTPSPDLIESYQQARDRAGRSPSDHVRLALWCEARGLSEQRLRHLGLAVLADPGNVAARGLLGFASHRGRWLRPEAVAAEIKVDPTLAEYESRRSRAPYMADAQWALGLWAEEHGLMQQARAHLTAVIRLDPSRDAAWKKLGYRRFEGRWRTDAQVAAGKADVEAQERADRTWPPTLAGWRDGLGIAGKRAEAERGLDGLTDPRAVASVVKVFGLGGPVQQSLAVRLLGQIDTPRSSRALAMLATWGKTPAIRRTSAEILAHRDPREFLGMLIGGFRQTVRYELGSTPSHLLPGYVKFHLAVEGRDHDYLVKTLGDFPVPMVPPRLFDDSVPFDPNGLQASHSSSFGGSFDHSSWAGMGAGALSSTYGSGSGLVDSATVAASFRDAEIARSLGQVTDLPRNFKAHVTDTMAQIDAYNESTARANEAIHASLVLLTGQNLPKEPEPWKRWWFDSLGYSYKSPQSSQAAFKPTYEYTVVSCFAAGTAVRTQAGDRPIESLRVGDQVLAQDQATGGLRYRSIAGVHHNPPAMVLRVKLGDEVILATGFHRFWKAGRGWIMARELKPGDVVRTLEGLIAVESVQPDRVQPVFNLDVADDADFFVGRLGALVHDNTLPDVRLAPFDDPATAVAGSKPAK